MFVTIFFGLAEADAVDDGSVVEFVRDDGVIGRQQNLEQAGVGVETTRVEDGIFATVELGYLLFQGLKKTKEKPIHIFSLPNYIKTYVVN